MSDAAWRDARPGETPGQLTPEGTPPQPLDLHAHLTAAIQHRLDLARAAEPTHFAAIRNAYHRELGAYLHANDPAAIIRLCEGALRIVERHRPDHRYCAHCAGFDGSDVLWPCDEIDDLAAMFGAEVTG